MNHLSRQIETALIIAAALLITSGFALAAEQWQVIDGDSLIVNGQKVRLVGFDTPETCNKPGCPEGGRPKCNAELELGLRATARLRELTADERKRELRYVMDPETKRPRVDHYGRQLGLLYVGGENVADILIREGLARILLYEYGERRRGWCN